MSKLEELVPPLNLCELIPKGEFEDSALRWLDEDEGVIPTAALTIPEKYIPAPTLQEIMEKLPPYAKNEHILACCVPDWADFDARVFGEHWRVGYTGDASINDKSPVTAALKLWLKLKGDAQNSAEVDQ